MIESRGTFGEFLTFEKNSHIRTHKQGPACNTVYRDTTHPARAANWELQCVVLLLLLLLQLLLLLEDYVIARCYERRGSSTFGLVIMCERIY